MTSSRSLGWAGWLRAAVLGVSFGLAPAALMGQAKPIGFYLDRLPKGKSVTIPKPATTFVPLTSRVVLTATDMPQSVSFRPVNVNNGAVVTIRLSIFDPGSERVQYVDVKPGTPFLYTFKELGSITVVPKVDGSTDQMLALQVESNKPLEIAH